MLFFSFNSFTPWAWAQELSSTIQLLGQSLVLPRHSTTCLLNCPNHSLGGSPGQQPFPVGILDVANLLWRTGECHSIDMARYCPVSLSQHALAQLSWLPPMLLQIPASHSSLHSKSSLKSLASYTFSHCRIVSSIIKNILAVGEKLLHLVAVFHAFPFRGLASFRSSMLASFIPEGIPVGETSAIVTSHTVLFSNL